MTLNRILQLLYGVLMLSCGAIAPALASRLPGDSVYRIRSLHLVDQRGDVFSFASLAGTPRLVGMFYGSCRLECPVEIETLKYLERQVLEGRGPSIPVLLVSFDPAHDDVAVLRRLARRHGLHALQFELTRPVSGDYRALGAVLGIAWRPLPQGGFAHNEAIVLLDARGRIVARTDGSAPDVPAFVHAIRMQQRVTSR